MQLNNKKTVAAIILTSMFLTEFLTNALPASAKARTRKMKPMRPVVNEQTFERLQLKEMTPEISSREARTISDVSTRKLNRTSKGWLTRDEVIQLLYPNGGYVPLQGSNNSLIKKAPVMHSQTLSGSNVSNVWKPELSSKVKVSKKSKTLKGAKQTVKQRPANKKQVLPVENNENNQPAEPLYEQDGSWVYDGEEYQRYVQEKRRATPKRKPQRHYFMHPESVPQDPDEYDSYGSAEDLLPPEPAPVPSKSKSRVRQRQTYNTPEEIDRRFREIYEEYMAQDKGMTPHEAVRRAQTADFDEDDGEFVPPKEYVEKIQKRKGQIRDAKIGHSQKDRVIENKNEFEIAPRKMVNPEVQDTFYSKLEDVRLGGLDLLVLRGDTGKPRAFTVIVDPDNYSGIDQVTTFYSANLAPVFVKMLRVAADQYEMVPGGERIGSMFRRDPLGKIGITLTKSLDKAGEVIISNYTRPRTGDPMAFHAMLMNEAGLTRNEIISNTRIYKDLPTEFAGAFSDDPTVMLRTSVGVSPGKLEEYAVAVEGLFLKNKDPLR